MAGNWAKRAPLLGVLSIGLFIAAFAVGGDTPNGDASAQKVVSFYAHDHHSDQIAGTILLMYAALFLVFFAGALRSALRSTERGTGGLSALSFGGALLMAVGFTIFAGLTFTLVDFADDVSPAAAQAVNALNSDLFPTLAIGTALFNISTGMAIVRGGALPGWLGWVAIVIGLISMTPAGFIGVMLTGIWIIIASIMLTARTPAAA